MHAAVSMWGMGTPCDRPRLSLEASSLRQAVELARELRIMSRGEVQVRPAPPSRQSRRWRVTLIKRAPKDGHLRHGAVRVLIVDDSAPFRRAASELLKRRGYQVVGEADCAAAALEAAERLTPDAILLDVRLPDGCGFELSSRLTRAHPELAVLLVSSSDVPAPHQRVQGSGARGFVPKWRLSATPLGQFWPAP
jgi:CheY-like chemotaxis protein